MKMNLFDIQRKVDLKVEENFARIFEILATVFAAVLASFFKLTILNDSLRVIISVTLFFRFREIFGKNFCFFKIGAGWRQIKCFERFFHLISI